MGGKLQLALLGKVQVSRDGTPLAGFARGKPLALLIYLAVTGRPHTREALAGLLWGEATEANARASLRKALADLRRQVPAHVTVSRYDVTFNRASSCWLDVEAFDRGIRQSIGLRDGPLAEEGAAALAATVELYGGDFLDGFHVRGAPAFEEWVLVEREFRRLSALRALHALAGHHAARGAYGRAIDYTARLLALEPRQEEAHRQMMSLLAAEGQQGAALRQYQVCRRLLAAELGAEPALETTALYERIRDGTLETAPLLPSPTSFPPPSPLLSSAKEPAGERPVFVGRERELRQMDRFLGTALRGQGRVIFVVGEQGSGKTALICEFARRATAAHGDLVVAGGQCNGHIGNGDPYLPFLEILRRLTGDVHAQQAGGALTREQARRLRALLPAAVQALVEAGPDLIDLLSPGTALLARARRFEPWPGGATWRARLEALVERQARRPSFGFPFDGGRGRAEDAMAPAADPAPVRQIDLFEQVIRVLRALARRRPLILVLDDLQWADAGSMGLLFHLGRRLAGSRVLVVGAYRPCAVAPGRPSTASTVPLPSLSKDGSPWPFPGQAGGEGHPLAPVVREFQGKFGDIQVDLSRADARRFVDALLDAEPNRLSDAFRGALTRHTDGNPLFAVELLRAMQEQGCLVRDGDGRWVEGPALDWERLPSRVEAVIAQRLARLPPECQATLAAASVEGETFTAEVVARVRGVDEGEIVRCLSGALCGQHRLVVADSLQRLGGGRLSRYRFRHVLFQKYLYHGLDEVERAHLHEAVGIALETVYEKGEADRKVLAALAPQLAWHFEAAGLTAKAVGYLLRAGQRAARLCANEKAIAHFDRGVALLATLPDSPGRDRQELALQLSLCAPWQALGGYACSGRARASARAYELCQKPDVAPSQLPVVLTMLWSVHFMRSELQTARGLAERLLSLAQREQDARHIALGHRALGTTLARLGEFAPARAHLEQAIVHYARPDHRSLALLTGQDAGAASLAWAAVTLWALGYPDQAVQQGQEALALAHALAHPPSLGGALVIAGGYVHLLRREVGAVQEQGEALRRHAIDKGMPHYSGWAAVLLGWAQADAGQIEGGIAQLGRGPAAGHLTQANCERVTPSPLGLLAEVHGAVGQPERGLWVLGQALARVERTGERFWEAELYRVKGELLLQRAAPLDCARDVPLDCARDMPFDYAQDMPFDSDQDSPFGDAPDVVEAEACFQRAVEVARRQGAKSWELRATTSLGRLWQGQGKRQEARHALAEIYGWFTEGFDTPDLMQARELLSELRADQRDPGAGG